MRGIAGLFVSALILTAAAAAPAAVNTAAPVSTVQRMPPVERPWSERDYQTALALFRQNGPSALPRAASPVMQRLIDPDNLAILADDGTPLDARLRQGTRLVQSTTDILRLYLGALTKDPARNDDVLWVEAFMLQEASLLVQLANRRVGELDPASTEYAERTEGLTQMKSGLRELVIGCLMALQSNGPAAAGTREHLAAVLHGEWPKITGLLPPAARSEIEAALKQFAAHERDAGVKAAFAGM